jgi:large repetitive protein
MDDVRIFNRVLSADEVRVLFKAGPSGSLIYAPGMQFVYGGGQMTPPASIPEAPSNLSAQTISNNRIDLTWEDNSDGDSREMAFEIQRGTVSGSYTDTFLVNANNTAYSDRDVSANITYYYRIRAYNVVGSSYSNEVEVSIIDDTPPSVDSISASKNSVIVNFSETLDPASAGNINNYSIDGGIQITGIETASETVILTTSDHTDQNGGNYILTISNVEDIYGNPMPETAVGYRYEPIDTTEGLVAYWKLNENGGGEIFDSSPSGINGSIHVDSGSPNDLWTTGKFDAALGFNGSSYVELGTSDLDLTNEITVSLWINIDQLQPNQIVLAKGQYANPFRIRLEGSGVEVIIRTSTTNYLDSVADLAAGEWSHIAFTYGNGSFILYINGESDCERALTGNVATGSADILMGSEPQTFLYGLDGALDDVRIYNRALSVDEIETLYNQSAEVLHPAAPGNLRVEVLD